MKTVEIAPLSRVEGHGRVELQMNRGRLVAARVAMTESPRLFEGLVLGRDAFEVPALVCRICAICSTVHRVAACQAMETALGVTIPPLATSIRELAVLGGHIESHCLHLFCLVLPDVEGTPSIFELLRSGNELAREGLVLKSLGNRLQELAGGRTIHPINIEIGGVLGRPDRSGLAKAIDELTDWPQRLSRLVAPFFDPSHHPAAAEALGRRIAVTGADAFSLTGEHLALSDGRTVEASDYAQLLHETPVTHSNAKQSRLDGAPLLCGALARLDLNPGGQALLERCGGKPPAGIHANNAAQAAELLWAVKRARELAIEILDDDDGTLQTPSFHGPGSGTAVIEAPRGLLVHHYALDDMGRIAAADIVTPTAINQAAMEEQIMADLSPLKDESDIVHGAERIVRAYDPCISCSVHVMRCD